MKKHDLLPGLTVMGWRRIDDIVGAIEWVLFAAAVPAGILASRGVLWALPTAVGLLGVGLFAIAWFNFGLSPGRWKDQREIDADYTTMPLPHRPEVDVVERTTGIVIRPAGSPPITMAEYRMLSRRIRGGEGHLEGE